MFGPTISRTSNKGWCEESLQTRTHIGKMRAEESESRSLSGGVSRRWYAGGEAGRDSGPMAGRVWTLIPAE